jgi:hypothetical protein
MKKLFLLLLLLTIACAAQTRYYWPSPVNSSNGRPLNGQTLGVFDATADTLVATLTYATGSDGRYYSTTPIPTGTYTLKMQIGGNWIAIKGHENIKYTDWSMTEIREIVGDSLNAVLVDSFKAALTVADTTALKTTTGNAGEFVYLKQLSSSNTAGGGLFVYQSSGTVDGVTTFAASGGGVWVRETLINGKLAYTSWGNSLKKIATAANTYKATLVVDSSLTTTEACTISTDILPKGGVLNTSGSGSIYINNGSVIDNGLQVFHRDAKLDGYLSNTLIEMHWFSPGDTTACDSNAIANAVKLGKGQGTNADFHTVVNFSSPHQYRAHEIDLEAITGLTAPKVKLQSTSTRAARLYYDGAGGDGSYLINWGSISFSGVRNLFLLGYLPGVSTAPCHYICKSRNQFDMTADIEDVALQLGRVGWYHSGAFTNMYFTNFRTDALVDYGVVIDLTGVTGMENRPVKFENFTVDNNNTLYSTHGFTQYPTTGGFLKIIDPEGVDITLENARIEMNSAMADSSGFVYFDNHTANTISLNLKNITGYLSNDGQFDYIVATTANSTSRVNLTIENSQFSKVRAIWGYNIGSGIIEKDYTSEFTWGDYRSGGNVQTRQYYRFEDNKIVSRLNANIQSDASLYRYGDIIFVTDEVTPSRVKKMVYPLTGLARPLADSLVAATGTAGTNTIKVSSLSILFIGSNVLVYGAGYNGANLKAKITDINYADTTLTLDQTLQTNITNRRVSYQAPTFRYDPNYQTAAPTNREYYQRGEIIWNSNAASAGKVGWVCIEAGFAHQSSTGDVTNGSNQITNVTSVSTWAIGDPIKGTGIPSNTVITNISGTTLTISQNATATGTGVSLYDAKFKTWGAID